jgi:hypothetical protein
MGKRSQHQAPKILLADSVCTEIRLEKPADSKNHYEEDQNLHHKHEQPRNHYAGFDGFGGMRRIRGVVYWLNIELSFVLK